MPLKDQVMTAEVQFYGLSIDSLLHVSKALGMQMEQNMFPILTELKIQW